MGGERGGVGRDAGLDDLDVVDAGRVPGAQVDRPPHAGSDEARAPVPAVVIAGLPRKGTDPLVAHAAVFALIVGGRRVVAQGRQQFQAFGDRRTEQDAQGIVAGDDVVLDIGRPGAEHVVGLQDQDLIDIDVGIGVEAFEKELDMLAREGLGVDVEPRPVFPVLFVDPLLVVFVGAVKRILDLVIGQQVGMDRARHRRGQPSVAVGLAEGPCLAQFAVDKGRFVTGRFRLRRLGQGGRRGQGKAGAGDMQEGAFIEIEA